MSSKKTFRISSETSEHSKVKIHIRTPSRDNFKLWMPFVDQAEWKESDPLITDLMCPKDKIEELKTIMKEHGYEELVHEHTADIMKTLLLVLVAIFVTIYAQEEKYLANIQRLTFNGTNAEAYFSFDNKKLIFQAIRDGFKCDQIFSLDLETKEIKLLSNGKGRTTCSFFLKGSHEFIYSSTMDSMGEGCPPTPVYPGYVWPVYKTMAIYKARTDTGEIIQQLTNSGRYDAEATLSPDGSTILFTSARDSDLELYTMDLNGTSLKRLTYTPGYDGGAFFSHDGKKIVWRANRPRGQKLREYLDLLELGIVAPTETPMEIFIMDADGFNQKQITNLGGAAFAPYFTPNDTGVIFSSNYGSKDIFHLYSVSTDGKGLQQITQKGTFNSFPMFSRDGKYLVWISNRDASSHWGGMDIYMAEWKGINYDEIEDSSNYTWLLIVIFAILAIAVIGGISAIFVYMFRNSVFKKRTYELSN